MPSDARAHCGGGRLEMKAIYLELDGPMTEVMLTALAKTLLARARWHDTPKIIVDRAQPSKLTGLLHGARNRST